MGEADYELLMGVIKALEERVAGLEHDSTVKDRRISVLERRVVRKDHLLRIISEIADDELDRENNGEVNGEEDEEPS